MSTCGAYSTACCDKENHASHVDDGTMAGTQVPPLLRTLSRSQRRGVVGGALGRQPYLGLMDRQEYAHLNAQRYLDWAGGLVGSPYSEPERFEWAIITAHTPFQTSVAGFLASRGATTLTELCETLAYAGVLGAGNKASYIIRLREGLSDGSLSLPSPPYHDWRRTHKLPGLMHTKLSFGICLCDPYGSDVVCIDVHVGKVYGADSRRIMRSLSEYERVELQILREADEVGLPPFCFQWAVWDWQRVRATHRPPTNHDFLWANPTQVQLPLFSSLEG